MARARALVEVVESKRRPLSDARRARASAAIERVDPPVLAALTALIHGVMESRVVEHAQARLFIAHTAAADLTKTTAAAPLGRRVCLQGTAINVKKAWAQNGTGDAQLLGRGAFGEVYQLGDRAVKVVTLTPQQSWHPGLAKNVEGWGREVRVAKLCGELGVGPAVHDAYICQHEATRYGVIVMDLIKPAVTLEEWRRSQAAIPKDVQDADALLRDKMQRMHDHGISHGDLHAGNVVVVPATMPERPFKKAGAPRKVQAQTRARGVKDVFIVDYGFARSFSDLREDDRWDLEHLGAGRMPVAGDDAFERDVLERLVLELGA